MALKTFVKVGRVNNLSDARYCAGMNVDLIGFNLDKDDENYVDITKYAGIKEWLSGIKYVGEFETSSIDEIEEAIEAYEPDYIQITDISMVPDLRDTERGLILNIDIRSLEDLLPRIIQCKEDISYLLLESQEDRVSETQKDVISAANKEVPVLLGFGFAEDNVEALIDEVGVSGISLNGGDEIRPGFKDYDELADILEALEAEEF
ncbi:MAG: phosphoribosylanthranilate isomerase [Bacteroidota bacterium]